MVSAESNVANKSKKRARLGTKDYRQQERCQETERDSRASPDKRNATREVVCLYARI